MLLDKTEMNTASYRKKMSQAFGGKRSHLQMKGCTAQHYTNKDNISGENSSSGWAFILLMFRTKFVWVILKELRSRV